MKNFNVMEGHTVYDVLILGAGPAGLSAGIYAARAGLSTLIIEKGIDGGQIAVTHAIENYPGQSNIEGEPGTELIAPMTAQCARFGCVRASDEILSVDLSGSVKKLSGAGNDYYGRCVIICTGAVTRSIGCRNEAEYIGRGVSYCAVCDANFFRGLEIYAVGGNAIAAEEALYLADFGRSVTILCKGHSLTVSTAMAEKLRNTNNLRICTDTEIVALGGEGVLSEMTLRSTLTGEERTVKASEEDSIFGVFCFAGKKTTGIFDGILPLEEKTGYIRTNEKMETGIPGVYAAGDVRVTPLRQVVTACSDGAVAAMQCVRYLRLA